MSKDGEIEDDVTQRVLVGWIKQRSASEAYHDKCWATKKKHASKMNVAKMRMSKWMCGKNLRDRIRNKISRSDRVPPIEDKIRETQYSGLGMSVPNRQMR